MISMGVKVYKCLNCGMIVKDPAGHTEETGHIKGYREIQIPISV